VFSEKAVSPVIATLLLILIAVAAAVLVYVWVTGYASSVTGTGAPELQERIKVEAVSYKSDTGDLVVYVRNIGDTTATITNIYVIEAGSNNVKGTLSFNVDLTPGDVTSFGTDGSEADNEDDSVDSVPLDEGVTYIIKVVTKSGVEASLSFSYST